MVFCAGFWDPRRIWPSEMKGRAFWPRKQLVQMPREKREQALSWCGFTGRGVPGLLGGFSLAFPPMIDRNLLYLPYAFLFLNIPSQMVLKKWRQI